MMVSSLIDWLRINHLFLLQVWVASVVLWMVVMIRSLRKLTATAISF